MPNVIHPQESVTLFKWYSVDAGEPTFSKLSIELTESGKPGLCTITVKRGEVSITTPILPSAIAWLSRGTPHRDEPQRTRRAPSTPDVDAARKAAHELLAD